MRPSRGAGDRPSRRRVLQILAVALALPAAAEAGPFAPAVGQTQSRLRVLNWNVLYGFNHHRSIDAGARWISRQAPDVVALQELNGNKAKSLQQLAARWNHPHAVLLKETGFPVGLTSRAPIEIIERRVKGFHHGYLHCRTRGVHFFVVHFWPGKDHEAKTVAAKVRKLLRENARVIVLGDFNTHSRKDAAFLATRTRVKASYTVVDLFESLRMVDLVHKHSPQSKYSCPSPITIPRWSATAEVVKSKRQRVDFVFADEKLARDSRKASIPISRELDRISDHYPVVVDFVTAAADGAKPGKAPEADRHRIPLSH